MHDAHGRSYVLFIWMHFLPVEAVSANYTVVCHINLMIFLIVRAIQLELLMHAIGFVDSLFVLKRSEMNSNEMAEHTAMQHPF